MKEITYVELAKAHRENNGLFYLYKKKNNTDKQLCFYSTSVSLKKAEAYLFGNIEKIDEIHIPLCYLTDMHTAYKSIKNWMYKKPYISQTLQEYLDDIDMLEDMVISNNKEANDLIAYMIFGKNIARMRPVLTLTSSRLANTLSAPNDKYILFDSLKNPLKELGGFIDESSIT